jgi:hypothetical protein
MSNPKIEAKGKVEVIPPHKIGHANRKRAESEWKKNRVAGFVRAQSDITIDDRKIAIQTRRNFYELKSFGQTMHWSLDKQVIEAAKTAMEHSYIEERMTPWKKTEKISVKPKHITIWEYNPRTSQKRRIA